MAKINIPFTLFSAFYSPLISIMSGGFLKEEGLEPEWSISPKGKSAIEGVIAGGVDVCQTALSQRTPRFFLAIMPALIASLRVEFICPP